MFESIYQAAVNTPWWVYLLLFILIRIGINASKTQVISFKKIFILPIILTFLTVHTLFTSTNLDALNITAWIVSMFVGSVLGILYVKRFELKVDKKNLLIETPGSWSTLIMIILIFGIKYYFGYELAVDPALANQTIFEYSMLILMGLCTSLFIGKMIWYSYCMKNQEHVNLTENIPEINSNNQNDEKNIDIDKENMSPENIEENME